MRTLSVALLLTLVLTACGADDSESASPSAPPATRPSTTTATTAPAVDPEAFATDLERWVSDELEDHPEIPGQIALVDAPGLHVVTAQGVADGVGGTEPATAEHRFRIASVTKTFVAATVLRLVEQGELSLEDPVADHLPPVYVDLLEGDGYAPDEITVEQLLHHSSGIYDYAFDDEYVTRNAGDIHHRWTPEEQVRFAMDHGDPLWGPGEGYEYSDTGYVLAGQVIETVSGQPLPEAVRTVLDFEGLGLTHTFFETLEPDPDPGAPRFHNVFAEVDLTASDPSVDLYGGGGLMSTVEDIGRFYRALFAGEVFDDPATLEIMTTPDPVSGREQAAMGIFEIEAAGAVCYGHLGFYGTEACHCPSLGLTIVRETGQALPDERFSYDHVDDLIAAAFL